LWHKWLSRIFEAILLCEFANRSNLILADLAAGAHTTRYIRFLKFLKKNKSKLFWADQSPYMIDYAKKNTAERLKDVLIFEKAEMVNFLKEHKVFFDGLILKYSFNYVVNYPLEKWLETMHGCLRGGGKVIANLHFYLKGMKERSSNALYFVNGKLVENGYQPKNNEIIDIKFLEKTGDISKKPNTFAKTKIIYYTKPAIISAAKQAGFRRVAIFDDWQENTVWLKKFETLNPKLALKPKPFLLLER